MEDATTKTTVLATDCGSTTTKAILFEKTKNGWRQTFRGEAPTTVEKPVADVTIGVFNACLELEEISGRKILNYSLDEYARLNDDVNDSSDNKFISPFLYKSSDDDTNGIDLYISTSSAGGGLQMIVAGVVHDITSASAERAALGAGAIVMDAIALDDNRERYEHVEKIRHLRPDIILIAGGTDGGTIAHPIELAEIILQANPRPRFGDTLKVPVIYAANEKAVEEVGKILEKDFALTEVQNLRPTIEVENLAPARDAIHELFLKHVMSHAPGYKKLLSYSPIPIIPTPVGCGEMIQTIAKLTGKSVLAADIGGATTDVFSVFNVTANDYAFNRTVSANFGLSYSVANVLISAGIKKIKRWLPFQLDDNEIENRLRNKMVRPTTIPQTMEDLILEQAVCREALALAFAHHKMLAVGLKGQKKKFSFGSLFRSESDDLIDMLKLDMIIGSGGVLSHAPDRKSAAFMLIDAYQPVGVTELAVDSVFMLPHLGVFSTVNSEAALKIFERDCIVYLGTVVAPQGIIKIGKPAFKIRLNNLMIEVCGGDIKTIPLQEGRKVEIEIIPLRSDLDFGAGAGCNVKREIVGGIAGIILDARGRDIIFGSTEAERIEQVGKWYKQMEI